MTTTNARGAAGREPVSRRDFLAASGKTALGAAMVCGAGTLVVPSQGWGMELKALAPRTMATLIQMARDIYPHDRVADRYYAKAVKGFDEKSAEDEALHRMIEESAKDLDARSVARLSELGLSGEEGEGGYLDLGWEEDRVRVLRDIEDTELFQTIRGSLVVGLYNQKAIWPLFGYEGASAHLGGYLERGFDDIDWV